MGKLEMAASLIEVAEAAWAVRGPGAELHPASRLASFNQTRPTPQYWCIRSEYPIRPVRVCARLETRRFPVLPGWRQSRQFAMTAVPIGRFGNREEVAAAVVYLASADAAYVTGATCTSMAAWR